MKFSQAFSRGSLATAMAAAAVVSLLATPVHAARTPPGASRPPAVKPPATPKPVTPPCKRGGAGNVSRC
jgi:hypothetical protein